jgi:hypothetical protein
MEGIIQGAERWAGQGLIHGVSSHLRRASVLVESDTSPEILALMRFVRRTDVQAARKRAPWPPVYCPSLVFCGTSGKRGHFDPDSGHLACHKIEKRPVKTLPKPVPG